MSYQGHSTCEIQQLLTNVSQRAHALFGNLLWCLKHWHVFDLRKIAVYYNMGGKIPLFLLVTRGTYSDTDTLIRKLCFTPTSMSFKHKGLQQFMCKSVHYMSCQDTWYCLHGLSIVYFFPNTKMMIPWYIYIYPLNLIVRLPRNSNIRTIGLSNRTIGTSHWLPCNQFCGIMTMFLWSLAMIKVRL